MISDTENEGSILQEGDTVHLLGPPNSYSHELFEAIKEETGLDLRGCLHSNFPDVFAAAKKDGHALVPFSNANTGIIFKHIIMGVRSGMGIHHSSGHLVKTMIAMANREGCTLDSATKLFSKDIALQQVSTTWADANNLELIPMDSSSAAAEFVADKKHPEFACVCSPMALANNPSLKMVTEHAGRLPGEENVTGFHLWSKDARPRLNTKMQNHAIAMDIMGDLHGVRDALRELLACQSDPLDSGINGFYALRGCSIGDQPGKVDESFSGQQILGDNEPNLFLQFNDTNSLFDVDYRIEQVASAITEGGGMVNKKWDLGSWKDDITGTTGAPLYEVYVGAKIPRTLTMEQMLLQAIFASDDSRSRSAKSLPRCIEFVGMKRMRGLEESSQTRAQNVGTHSNA